MVEVSDATSVQAGERFAAALAGKQATVLADLLAPDIDFRGLTPGRTWEASSRANVLEILLSHWFAPTDVIEELLSVETSMIADRRHVSYRLRGHDPQGPFVVEQQMYFMTDDDQDRITWMRVLCSGFRTPTD